MDSRDWLEAVEGYGQLKRISGANWDLEIMTLLEKYKPLDPLK